VVTVPDERWFGLWPSGAEPVDVRVWDMTGDPPGAPELVVLPYIGASAVVHRLAQVPSLRVVQTLTAGYENVLPHVPEGVLLASGAGIHDTSTAELAVGLAIACWRAR
jgi:lactate dehydrogenase-like 2-hydroxyacid dehydrogenase